MTALRKYLIKFESNISRHSSQVRVVRVDIAPSRNCNCKITIHWESPNCMWETAILTGPNIFRR